ncbi:serine/threonine-protein phosphatase 6 regulatory ankyrin repeat subunit C [Haematococcus lacustris]|uniref:Serine/threonine-protein phosphatase 6 regulatory ankyrin repeat subunit C n=1 Tax=Haematococcus lacustris TaxID=44745 RepID=A0A699ZA78_HAELA|nr:serine/threonine-protein phosphatase 6 regulatory ankyrin repeat subunit C [Haematococcus lacustris]
MPLTNTTGRSMWQLYVKALGCLQADSKLGAMVYFLLHQGYGASDFIRLWFRCGGKVNVVCSTPVKGAEVPTTLANYLASQVVLGPNEKAAKVQGETEAVEKVDLLDETEEAVLEFSPEDEEEEDSDHEEEQCRQNKEKRKAEGKPVGEGVEDDYWREDLSLAPQPSQHSFYTRPSRKQVSKWRKQGMGWWDTWLDDVKAQTDAHSCDDMDVALSQLLNPMHEDWVLEARDGPFSPDELLLEAIKQQENGCRAVAEGLMDDMTKQLTNKVTPLSGEEKPKISAAEAIQNCTVAEAIKQASELLKAEYQRHGLDMDDPYFLPDTLYQGQPKFMQIDLSPHSQQDIDNLVAAMHKRMDEYDELREPTLVGMPMRQRNLKWWLRSLCAEEYPMKVGAWRKLAKLTATALRVAAERVPSGVPLPQRKRTVFFGLPELPSRLELEETSALILAVRLGRVDCLQALLDCGDRTLLNKRDLWGHSALDYAYFMFAKDKRNMILQQMVDMLLYARPEVMAKVRQATSISPKLYL